MKIKVDSFAAVPVPVCALRKRLWPLALPAVPPKKLAPVEKFPVNVRTRYPLDPPEIEICAYSLPVCTSALFCTKLLAIVLLTAAFRESVLPAPPSTFAKVKVPVPSVAFPAAPVMLIVPWRFIIPPLQPVLFPLKVRAAVPAASLLSVPAPETAPDKVSAVVVVKSRLSVRLTPAEITFAPPTFKSDALPLVLSKVRMLVPVPLAMVSALGLVAFESPIVSEPTVMACWRLMDLAAVISALILALAPMAFGNAPPDQLLPTFQFSAVPLRVPVQVWAWSV